MPEVLLPAFSGCEWGCGGRIDQINFIPIVVHRGVDISLGLESDGPVFESLPLWLLGV